MNKEIAIKHKIIRAIGLVTKLTRLPFDAINDLLKLLSSKDPRITPSTVGAAGYFCFSNAYPKSPIKNIT